MRMYTARGKPRNSHKPRRTFYLNRKASGRFSEGENEVEKDQYRQKDVIFP